MNLKKILTVAAVSVTAAAFALLIVIFAMPNPEDRPPQLNDGTEFFKKYPTLESLLFSEDPKNKSKALNASFRKLDPPYQGFNSASFNWDANDKIWLVILSEENPPKLSADDEKKRIKAYAEDFFWHWRIASRDIAERIGIPEAACPRYDIRFVEAEDKYDIQSGKMVRKGAGIFIKPIEKNASSDGCRSAKFAE